MNIVRTHNPKYTIMIGTCASIKQNHKLGTVLIPRRVFSYESGKYENGVSKPDYESKSFGSFLRNEAELLNSRIKNVKYSIITDEDFCSGGAVIDDPKMINKIDRRGGRKLSGLDMEAYSIACINSILTDKELIVVKAISDYAKKKKKAEKKGNKELAQKNSADFTLRLIKHLQEKVFSQHNKSNVVLGHQGIVILSATYCWPNGQVPVTENIRELISRGITEFIVDPGNLGVKDPIYGTKKTLDVHYKINGKERGKRIEDGRVFKFD